MDAGALVTWLQSVSPWTFFVVNIFVTIASPPGVAAVVSSASGAIYGLWVGTLLYTASSVAGAITAYFLARSCLRTTALRLLESRRATVDAVDSAVAAEGWKMVM